jgi:hypothetical protein
MTAPAALSPSASTVRQSAARARVVPRLTLNPAEGAASLGCSRDFFDKHVLPELRVIRRGRKIFIPVAELERWVHANSAFTLGRP